MDLNPYKILIQLDSSVGVGIGHDVSARWERVFVGWTLNVLILPFQKTNYVVFAVLSVKFSVGIHELPRPLVEITIVASIFSFQVPLIQQAIFISEDGSCLKVVPV